LESLQVRPTELDAELVEYLQNPWGATIYPEARELGGCARPSPIDRLARGQWVSHRGKDPQRSAVEGSRRARSNLRRYCAANRLDRLGTLTYGGAGQFDQIELREHVHGFWKALRSTSGFNEGLPYVWVPEWHKEHGLHVHFAVGRYIPQKMIKEVWGKGFVHITRLSKGNDLAQSRLASGYLSKYVAKSFADPLRIEGLHRYEIAQGFKPRQIKMLGSSPADLLNRSCRFFDGVMPDKTWFSDDSPEWQGGKAIWAQWS